MIFIYIHIYKNHVYIINKYLKIITYSKYACSGYIGPGM